MLEKDEKEKEAKRMEAMQKEAAAEKHKEAQAGSTGPVSWFSGIRSPFFQKEKPPQKEEAPKELELVAVKVPEGSGPGAMIKAERADGTTVRVVVPTGQAPGGTFYATV